MTSLENELRALAPSVEFPPDRDLAPSVRARIGAARPRPGRLVLALALVVVALAVAFAVPPARSTILRWFGIGNARIELVDRLPKVHARRPLDLGERTSLSVARKRVDYHVVRSALLGTPQEVHVRGDQIAYIYGDRKLLVTQTRGTFFTKEVGTATRVDHVRVNGQDGLWIAGAPHYFGYIDTIGRDPQPTELYLAGDALIWQRNELTLRLEGKLSKARALRIASSFR